jgi:hypothetical protein
MSTEQSTEQSTAPAAGLPDPYEVVASAAFDHAVGIAAALVGACSERDAALAGRLCADAVNLHGVDGVFTTALVLAEMFAVKTGVGPLADSLRPGQTAFVDVRVPGMAPMFEPRHDSRQRREVASTFTQRYILGEEDKLYAALQACDTASHLLLLHGLCELAAAFFPPPQRP